MAIINIKKYINKHFTKGRGGVYGSAAYKKINSIVIHHNAGDLTVDQIYKVWQTREASAHFQIQSNGKCGQIVRLRDTAWHCPNLNSQSIGIEIANKGSGKKEKIDLRARRKLKKLLIYLCKKYPNIKYICGHKDAYATACPGLWLYPYLDKQIIPYLNKKFKKQNRKFKHEPKR
jgi:N-acetyl-anhydromuramyl-L-alanine amidase AmpD